MNTCKSLPGFIKPVIDEFYDKLCRTLTEWEQGEISDFELYAFMVDVANDICNISYDD